MSRAILGVGTAVLLAGVACRDQHAPKPLDSAQTNSTSGQRRVSRADVLAYCQRMDCSSEGVRQSLATPEFDYVRQHLDEFLQDPETPKGSALSWLVWKAALLFGSIEQGEKAFDVCWSDISGGLGDPKPMDLATWEAERLRAHVLNCSRRGDALEAFLIHLADRRPNAWGIADYGPRLELLMGRSVDTSVRLRAAYCLARWSGESEVGLRAQAIVKSYRSSTAPLEKWLADFLWRDIESLGPGGWGSEQPVSESAPEQGPTSSRATIGTNGL